MNQRYANKVNLTLDHLRQLKARQQKLKQPLSNIELWTGDGEALAASLLGDMKKYQDGDTFDSCMGFKVIERAMPANEVWYVTQGRDFRRFTIGPARNKLQREIPQTPGPSSEELVGENPPPSDSRDS